MQKIINGIAIFSGVVALGVVGVGGYVFIRKDAIVDNIKSKVMESVMPDIGGGIESAIPDLTGLRYHSKNMAEVKKEEKKGLLGKIKEAAEDKEEQLAFLSTIVRLAVLVWSAGILTLNYVEILLHVQEQKIDPTFIASVFTGTLSYLLVFRLQARRQVF